MIKLELENAKLYTLKLIELIRRLKKKIGKWHCKEYEWGTKRLVFLRSV